MVSINMQILYKLKLLSKLKIDLMKNKKINNFKELLEFKNLKCLFPEEI